MVNTNRPSDDHCLSLLTEVRISGGSMASYVSLRQVVTGDGKGGCMVRKAERTIKILSKLQGLNADFYMPSKCSILTGLCRYICISNGHAKRG
jgi:hypothetical protein